jgi:proline dehydrogenase
MRALLLALARRPRIGAWMARLPVTRRLVRRFVAGTTPGEALAVLADLCASGRTGAVTYLGENVRTAEDAARATATYVHLLEEIRRRRLPVDPSLKLTHLGLDLGRELCLANVQRVLEQARGAGVRVWLDMESSAYTDRTLDVYAALRRQWPEAAGVLQAYLHRTPADAERMIELGAAVRLCKGAYREPPAIAYPDRRDVDRAYVALQERLLAPDALARGVYPAFATHDDRLIAHAGTWARAHRVAPDRFEIQMLHGIRGDLHAGVRTDGLRLRVLVPFGEDWYGYFMRRLAERPANLLFFLRALGAGRRRVI